MYELLTGQAYTGVLSEPTEWEMELTDYLGTKLSEIINTGIPTDWPRYTVDNPKQISIRNNQSSVITTVEDATVIHRTQYAIDHFIEISQVESTTSKTTTSSAKTVTEGVCILDGTISNIFVLSLLLYTCYN